MAFRSLLGMAQDRSQVFGQCQVKLQVIHNSRKDEEEGGWAISTTWDEFELKVIKEKKGKKKEFKKKKKRKNPN